MSGTETHLRGERIMQRAMVPPWGLNLWGPRNGYQSAGVSWWQLRQ